MDSSYIEYQLYREYNETYKHCLLKFPLEQQHEIMLNKNEKLTKKLEDMVVKEMHTKLNISVEN